jgi:hypothetical protein
MEKANDLFVADNEDFDISSHSINRTDVNDDEQTDGEQTDDDADELNVDKASTKTKEPRKPYIPKCSFENLEEILYKIKDGQIDRNKWTRKNTTMTNDATKIWFNCNGHKCSKKLVVEVNSVNIEKEDVVTLTGMVLIRDGKHEHAEKEQKNIISEATHKRIVELCLLGHKPERILQQLKSDGLDQPDKIFLNNLLKKIRKEKFGIKLPTFRELQQWCEDNKAVPEDDDAVFVGSYDIGANLEKKYFRIFLTTKRLMSFTKYVNIKTN